MNLCIFIGGAATSGKSTIVNLLLADITAYYYKPLQAFFDLAKNKNISNENVFSSISRNDAEQYFLKIFLANRIVLGDVHYAIQPNRYATLALNNDSYLMQDENYLESISKNLIDQLSYNRIKILAVLLYAKPNTLLNRAIARSETGKQVLRTVSIYDVENELAAEEKQWNILTTSHKLDGISIDISELYPFEVKKIILKKLMGFIYQE